MDETRIGYADQVPVRLSDEGWQSELADIGEWASTLSDGEIGLTLFWHHEHPIDPELWQIARQIHDSLAPPWKWRLDHASNSVGDAAKGAAPDERTKMVLDKYGLAMAVSLVYAHRFAPALFNEVDFERFEQPLAEIKLLIGLARGEPDFLEFFDVMMAGWSGTLADLAEVAESAGCLRSDKLVSMLKDVA